MTHKSGRKPIASASLSRGFRLLGGSVSVGLVLSIAAPGHAGKPYREDHWRQSSPRVSVDFLVAGRKLPRESARHGEPFVVVPRWGVEYEIRIENHESHDRVLFVVGVDGLSVMNGQSASQHSGGYVLGPGESYRIRGWRRGDDRVAAFTFTNREDSYAGKTGKRRHIGEVWVWAIREKSHRPLMETAPSPRASNRKAKSGTLHYDGHREGDTGTGYGDELVDHVRTTRFVRSNSIRRLTFGYGTRRWTQPHPKHRPEESFTPSPPGWKGTRL